MSVFPSQPAAGSGRSFKTAWAWLLAWLSSQSDHSAAQRMAGNAFAIRIVSAAIAYLSQVLLARWMGSFEFGIYVYVWTWVLVIGGIADLGLATAAQRLIPQYSGQSARLRGFLIGSRWLALGVSTATAAVSVLVVWLSAPWLDRYEVIPLYLACISLPFYALTEVQDGIARSFGWMNLGLIPPFIVRPLLLLMILAGAHFAGFESNAVAAISAAGFATFLTAAGQTLVLNRRLAAKVEAGPTEHGAGSWIRTSFPILVVTGFYLLLTSTDIIVLQQFRPPTEVAHYYAAAKTLALVAFIYFSVGAATAHKFAELHISGDAARLRQFLSNAIALTFWPSLAAAVLILALGWPFLWLFGPGFVDAYPVMFILAAGLLARAAVGPAERLLNMLGEQTSCGFIYGAAFLFNLVACLALVPPYGMVGAAVSTTLALLFESMLLFLVTKRRLGLHVFIWNPAADRPVANR